MAFPTTVQELRAQGFDVPPTDAHVAVFDAKDVYVAVHCKTCDEVLHAWEGNAADATQETGRAECDKCGGSWETAIDDNKYGELFGQLIDDHSGPATMYWKITMSPPDDA